MKKEATATYQWEGQGIIRRVDIRTQDNGRAVAYIYADDSNARQPERNAVRTALRGKGWGTLSDHSGDQFSLRVSGITDPQELISLLSKQGYMSGNPQVAGKQAQDPKSKGVGGFIRDNSLRISAIVYTVGNGLYWLSGKKSAPINKDRMNMATAFAVGDAALGIFGGRDDARQYKALLGKLKNNMETDGIEIPKTASIHVETARLNQGILGSTYDFLHTHINSIKMMAEVAGGFFAFRSGRKTKSTAETIGGAIVMGGWAAALLTKEKKPDQEKLQNAGTLEKTVAWIQEKPLRLAGMSGLAFNTVGFMNFNGKRELLANGQKGSLTTEGKWGLAAIGTMVGANSAYFISHKAPGGDIKTQAMVDDVYSVAAQIINKQPDAQRAAAIESTAKFLGERPEIKDTHSEIIQRLNKEVLIQRQNPWFENTRLAIRPVEAANGELKIHHPLAEDAQVALDTASATIEKAATPSTAIQTESIHQSRLAAQKAQTHQPTAAL